MTTESHVDEYQSQGQSPGRLRRTGEKLSAFEALRAIAGRYRVEPDAEGWPVIESRMGRGRIEWHDGRSLAVHFESTRVTSHVARYVKAGCRRHQIGDTEARLLFNPALLPKVARMIYAKIRRDSRQGRSSEAMARVRPRSPLGHAREHVPAPGRDLMRGAAS